MTFEDVWRLLISLTCIACIYVLALRFKRHSKDYNEKTRDLWYALVAWCAAGVIGPFARAFWDTGGPGLVMTTIAVVVSLRGLLRKGEWGAIDD